MKTLNTTTSNTTTANTTTTNMAENWGLKVLDKDFVYDIMSVPTYTCCEHMLVKWIEDWADKRGISHEKDNIGNLYLTKGTVAEGDYFPCLTSHLDTVQKEQAAYAAEGKRLELVTEMLNGQHKLSCNGFGIGADCKSGVAICLAIMERADAMKCCFFVQEESGCIGSKNMDLSFFSEVGYVLGFDSPEQNRAAWMCSRTPLFDADFFNTYLKDVCAQFGLTRFYSEPFTDVKYIREFTKLTCTNFGNGGYRAHQPGEYCVVEDMDLAAQMGLALVAKMGHRRLFSKMLPNDEERSYLESLGNIHRRLW